jgi:uncharacterized protein (DUF433 family)
MDHPYIEYRDGGYWVRGVRVSLDSLVYQWREGLSPESIKRAFPVLSLKQVYGALTYYLEHQEEIDEYLRQAEIEEKEIARKIKEQYPDIHRRMDEILLSARLRSS